MTSKKRVVMGRDEYIWRLILLLNAMRLGRGQPKTPYLRLVVDNSEAPDPAV